MALSDCSMQRNSHSEDESSLSNLLGGEASENKSDFDYDIGHQPISNPHNAVWKLCVAFLILLPWALLPLLYQVGYSKGSNVLPRLPTHNIVAKGIEYELKILDDEFYTTEPENLKYKGHPRPELDDAWNELISNMHMRVHPDEARAAGFESVELADGSGDLYALPVVFHNLHCLYALRRAMFPNVYIDDLDSVPPGPNQINVHIDHCFDIIRQALMCQGDMSLYYFYWPTSEGRRTHKFPRHVGHKQHVCVNWDNLMSFAHERRFSLLRKQKMLVNPFYPEKSLNDVVVPKRKNYSVYDGMDIEGPRLFQGLEDLGEVERLSLDNAGMLEKVKGGRA